MERPWDLEDSIKGGGIETCNLNSRNSGDSDSLLACTAMKDQPFLLLYRKLSAFLTLETLTAFYIP
jgi:hypothetical protein